MGHWYTKDGEAMHWIEGANGKQRDTTLRDAKKLGLLPSVTTILGILDKPALTNWKLKQVTRAAFDRGLETSIVDHLASGGNYDDYHSATMKQAFEDSTDARDRGSEIHDAIERWFNMEEPKAEDDVYDIACAAAEAISEYCGAEWFEAEKIVVGRGYAGKVDLFNDEFVVDWKTKDIEEGKKNHWPEMAMQLAAYDAALGCPKSQQSRRCINVFIDRTEPGKVVIHEWEPEEIDKAWQKFQLLLNFWQLDKGVK